MKRHRSIRSELQCKAKQDSISISKKLSCDILEIKMFFVRKGIAVPQAKFVFFLTF